MLLVKCGFHRILTSHPAINEDSQQIEYAIGLFSEFCGPIEIKFDSVEKYSFSNATSFVLQIIWPISLVQYIITRCRRPPITFTFVALSVET